MTSQHHTMVSRQKSSAVSICRWTFDELFEHFSKNQTYQEIFSAWKFLRVF